MGHPSGNVSRAVIDVGLKGRGELWSRELSVIGIEVMLKTRGFNEVT